MAVSAQAIKALRARTSAGMMDCRKALDACDGDLDRAIDWLRKKGLSDAARKSGRVAADGLVGVQVNGNAGVLVEVNAETDFVARNEVFQSLVREVAETAAQVGGDAAKVLEAPAPGGSGTVADRVRETIAALGENLQLRRTGRVSVADGLLVSYVHNAAGPGLGRIGVLVGVESAASDRDALATFARQVAMHVAAFQPLAVTAAKIPAAVIDREREICEAQAAESGKPPEVAAKMVEGRMKKFLRASNLLDQPFVVNPDISVAAAVEATAAELGAPVRVADFLRFAVGEGIERKESDFASEVADLAGG